MNKKGKSCTYTVGETATVTINNDITVAPSTISFISQDIYSPIMSLRDNMLKLSEQLKENIQTTLLGNSCCYEAPAPRKLKVEGNCPSCGAPITGDKCEYCGRVHYLRR